MAKWLTIRGLRRETVGEFEIRPGEVSQIPQWAWDMVKHREPPVAKVIAEGKKTNVDFSDLHNSPGDWVLKKKRES